MGRAHLRETLDSLARQNRHDFEIAVVDMSGGAASKAIALRRGLLPRLRHLEVGHPISRSRALNLGVRRTVAPAIAVLDDDNLYAPDHVDTLVRGLASTGADLVYTPVSRQTFKPDGELIHEVEVGNEAFSLPKLLQGNYIYATGIAFRRSIWKAVGGYDTRFPVFEDWDFLIRVGHAGRIVPIAGQGSVSRNFTGDPTRSAHNDEVADCARSAIGLRWTHRRRYADSLFGDDWRDTAGWLASWWWHCVLGRCWRRA